MNRWVITQPRGGSAVDTCPPTALVSEYVGDIDNIVQQILHGDAAGNTELPEFTTTPSDDAGAADALSSISADLPLTENVGPEDATPLFTADEDAKAVSATPDTDAWGDVWVDRIVTQQGVHQANGALLQVAATTAATRQDGYTKVKCDRYSASLSGKVGGVSTFTFTADWPTVALTPNATLQVDVRFGTTDPFVESAATANDLARFSLGQRTFTFPQDGTTRTHTITFTAAEVDDGFVGAGATRWLTLQFTTPDLTVGVFQIHARRSADATVAKYHLELQR
jgi:hypothetical protein